MSDVFIGQLMLVPYNFAPKGFAFCNGQLIPISQNTALFSLLGTTYGGDGKSNFALPNLQGRIPIGSGQAPGLSLYDLGQEGGSDTVALLVSEMPAHNHNIQVDTLKSSATDPTNAYLAKGNNAGTPYAPGNSSLTQPLAANALKAAGGGLPHNNLAPYLTMTWIIALQGIFPARG
jgi:microcystin-dependent protein